MIVTVLRPFPGPDGRQFQIGERLDTSGWLRHNREALIAQRYIQPARLSSGMEKKSLRTKEKPFEPSEPVKKKKRVRPVFDEAEA